MTKRRMEFRIDDREREIIEEVAEAENKSVSEVIRTMVREGMVRLFGDPKEKLDRLDEEIEKAEENLEKLKERRERLHEGIVEGGISGD